MSEINSPAFRAFRRFLILAPLFLPLSVFAEAAPISIAFAHTGNPPKIISGYRLGSNYFLSADEMARLYKAQIYWRPVSKIVELSRSGNILAFEANATAASALPAFLPTSNAARHRA